MEETVKEKSLSREEQREAQRQKRKEMQKEAWIKNVLRIYPEKSREETEELWNKLELEK